MPYNPVTFTVGQVLTATQMGLVQGNIDTVRISHRGPAPPTSPPGGAMWWDDSQAIWNLNLNTGSGSWIPALFLDTKSREAGLAAQGKTWGAIPMVDRNQARTVFAGMPYFPKNMLLNANFQYWQRGLSFNTTSTATYTSDRWILSLTGGGRVTIRQSSLVPTGVTGDYSMEMVVGSARSTAASGDILNNSQPVERSMLARAAYGRPDARPTRISFWMWCNATGRLSVQIQAGSYGVNYLAPVDIDVANTWLFKELQIPAPTSGSWQQRDNRVQAYLGMTFAAHSLFLTTSPGIWQYGPANLASCSGQLNLMGGIGTTFRWTAIQWEIGEISTPIEMLPEAIERLMLKRYYSKSFPADVKPGAPTTNSPTNFLGAYTTTGDAVNGYPGGMLNFPVTMRVVPIMRFHGIFSSQGAGTWWNATEQRAAQAATASGYIWREGCYPGVFAAATADKDDSLAVHWEADAEIYGWE